MRRSNEGWVATTIMAGFPTAQLQTIEVNGETEYQILFNATVLIEIDNKKAKFNFPTRTKGEMHWGGIPEGDPEQAGKRILRFLADAGYEVFRSPGKRIKKSSILLDRFIFCPSCNQPGHVKEIPYGLPMDNYDEDKYVLVGCCVHPEGKDLEIRCTNCDWSGQLKDVRFTRRKRSK